MVTGYSLVLDLDGEGILADMMLDSRNYIMSFFIVITLFFKRFYFILEYNQYYNNTNNVIIVSGS